ncbi:MAG TPA: bifunctional DNA-formamidopyrimidine glycosylase/DNA-(apurinic or apyrimidinic site) lyase [Terriglobales bacterium]|nr:bifunctional DNA-formamidopyrimidine glycosylase/DNA-(apurinic or apyrimidinic site) lyase [Terriglobales bacterium]
MIPCAAVDEQWTGSDSGSPLASPNPLADDGRPATVDWFFMPELPEVETIARGLDKRVAGDRIESLWLGSKPEPLKSPARQIAETLDGKRIVHVRRIGKHIVFDLESDGVARASSPAKKRRAKNKAGTATHAQWIVHLGMTGRMLVSDPKQEVEKHTHAIATLASGRELRFVDPRRFGRLSVTEGFEAPGSEPLELELERFVKLFKGRKTPIKSALLNQKLLSGVGNIYADESLFRAGIRSRRRAASLTHEELRRLYLAVQEVLKEAIDLGGSSISDYVDADGEEGFFQLQHRVYGREGEPCLVCKTPVKRVVIAGRSSHYCPKCQK